MIILGITGGIGSGKSLVCGYLKDKYNAVMLIADDIAHEVMNPGGICYEELIELLGTEYLLEDGTFDRKKIGDRAFRELELLGNMNKIIHPAVRKYILNALDEAREAGVPIAIIETAILIEAGYRGICDEYWYVHADIDVRIERLRQSRGMTKEKIASVMSHQLQEEEFIKGCDFVLENSGSFEETALSIDERIAELSLSAH